ncbi:putative triacylglycerol lipase [Helianthus anomalus]
MKKVIIKTFAIIILIVINHFSGQLLGFNKFIPSYATARNKDFKRGVNYGSGCAGIRKESGRHLGDRIFMNRQLRHHKSIVSKLTQSKKNRSLLKKCVYIVNIGSNDYLNNFFLHDIYNTSNKYTKDQYAKVLMRQFSRQLKVHILLLVFSLCLYY